MRYFAGSHHARCPDPWDDCECDELWRVSRAAEAEADLERAYGEFYDPDWDTDPNATPQSYRRGWFRA